MSRLYYEDNQLFKKVPERGYEMGEPRVHIGILSQNLYQKGHLQYDDKLCQENMLRETISHKVYSRKFKRMVLYLKNLENAPEEESRQPGGIDPWAKLFKTGSREE